MRIVLSGPIQACPDFLTVFGDAAERLRAEGHTVFNPADLPQAALAKIATQAEHQVALRRCVEEIALADELVVLPNWQVSKGARFEVFVAGELGVRVRFLEFA